MPQLQLRAQHWIGGAFVASALKKDSINPATGEVIGSYCDADAEVAQLAIDAAADCFANSEWRHDSMGRATALNHLADAFAARTEEVIDSLCLENGKLREEAGREVGHVDRGLRFAAGLAVQNFGRVMDPLAGQQAMAIRQPIGVAGLMIPWNSPVVLCLRALQPALAAGCTTVVKMPAQAAQTAQLMNEIMATVDALPPGAVNMFVESGSEGAKLLVDSPQVPVISFTGSTRVGAQIAQAAARGLKRVGLELGGKTPHVVFDDVDLEAALPVLVKSCTVFAGQFCMTGSRVLVQRGIAETLQRALAGRLEGVRPGPAADPASDMGPLIDQANVARVDAAVQDAIDAGAVPIVRGGPSSDPELAGGAFYHPTLLTVTDTTLPIVQEETFGPVQTLQVFDTEDEAVALANATKYGLSACVWTRDADRPIRIARRLEAGLISINSWANLTMEFEEGGWKSSGLGRLGGLGGLDDFLEYKQITQNYA